MEGIGRKEINEWTIAGGKGTLQGVQELHRALEGAEDRPENEGEKLTPAQREGRERRGEEKTTSRYDAERGGRRTEGQRKTTRLKRVADMGKRWEMQRRAGNEGREGMRANRLEEEAGIGGAIDREESGGRKRTGCEGDRWKGALESVGEGSKTARRYGSEDLKGKVKQYARLERGGGVEGSEVGGAERGTRTLDHHLLPLRIYHSPSTRTRRRLGLHLHREGDAVRVRGAAQRHGRASASVSAKDGRGLAALLVGRRLVSRSRSIKWQAARAAPESRVEPEMVPTGSTKGARWRAAQQRTYRMGFYMFVKPGGQEFDQTNGLGGMALAGESEKGLRNGTCP
ncbi:hypothetical protein B0H11DRAFT_2195647 [Mycena galericulata]|nr:hypothetical protein B0H11DRAFT_2195647 [Mycena galericulata]